MTPAVPIRRFEPGASGMWYASFLRECGYEVINRAPNIYWVRCVIPSPGRWEKYSQKEICDFINENRIECGLEPIRKGFVPADKKKEPPRGKSRPPAAKVLSEVSERHGISLADLTGDCRDREMAWPRQEAYYLLTKVHGYDTKTVGKFIGGRDHTTISSGARKHADRIARAMNGAA